MDGWIAGQLGGWLGNYTDRNETATVPRRDDFPPFSPSIV